MHKPGPPSHIAKMASTNKQNGCLQVQHQLSTSPYHANASSRSHIGHIHAHLRPWPSRLTQSSPGYAQTPCLPPYFGRHLGQRAEEQLLAAMLAQFGHRLPPALLPRHELVESRSQTS
uniref:Uncharacterized protein n=1 Tax=Haptolina ericina TaxID=156174 RepID=A0A7S3FA31_9EUKA